MNKENMTSKQRAIEALESKYGKYRNFSDESLEEEKLKYEDDRTYWERQYKKPVNRYQGYDAEKEINCVDERLDFINKVINERKGNSR